MNLEAENEKLKKENKRLLASFNDLEDNIERITNLCDSIIAMLKAGKTFSNKSIS